jgi:hypothetical protein
VLVLDKLGGWCNVGTRDQLQDFIDDDDREGDPHYSLPLLEVQRYNNKDLGEEWYVQDHKVESHRKGDGKDQVGISPQLKGQK